MRGWSIPAAYRFKSQPHRERSCNLQIAIELQRSAGRVAPFGMAKIDFDVITDIAAKCKIDGKPRVLHGRRMHTNVGIAQVATSPPTIPEPRSLKEVR